MDSIRRETLVDNCAGGEDENSRCGELKSVGCSLGKREVESADVDADGESGDEGEHEDEDDGDEDVDDEDDDDEDDKDEDDDEGDEDDEADEARSDPDSDGSDLNLKYICPNCEKLKRGLLQGGKRKAYEADFLGLEVVKTAGCEACAVIWDGIMLFKDFWRDRDYYKLVALWSSPQDDDTLEVHVMSGDERGFSEKIGVFQFLGTEGISCLWEAIKLVPGGSNVVEDPVSPESIALIRKWATTCRNNHPLCSNTGGCLPKRVLDVGDTIGGNVVRLYEPDSATESEPYTALSHCWGSQISQPPRTLKDNIGARKETIPYDELSKTFQDAILVTQQFGVRYLWVDSLCIIQDDEEDWQDQSGRMHHVYEGACLTIAATRANSGQEGCFSIRKPPEALYSGITVNKMQDHAPWTSGVEGTYLEKAETNPLLWRGWCYQERLLSTRVLHYTETELVWECKTTTWCECGGIRGHKYKSKFHANFDWRVVIEGYKATRLTCHTDELVALSGVASYLRKWVKGEYLAGMWTEDLISDLLWLCANGHRHPSYIAPSFSWASVVGPIAWPYEYGRNGIEDANMSRRYHVNFLEGRCVPASGNPFGAVSSGFIKLRGVLLPSSFTHTKGSAADVKLGSFTTGPFLGQLSNLAFFGLRAQHITKATASFDTEEDSSNSKEQKTYCMPVASVIRDTAKFCQQREGCGPIVIFDLVSCLVLAENVDKTYRRIGIVMFTNILAWQNVISETEIHIV